jgi:hypothetical protein
MDGVTESESQPRYAGYGRRAGALLLDAVIFGLPALAVQHWGIVRYPAFYLYSSMVSSVLWYGLSIWCVRQYGGTPGKLIVGLRIVTVDGHKMGTLAPLDAIHSLLRRGSHIGGQIRETPLAPRPYSRHICYLFEPAAGRSTSTVGTGLLWLT